MKLVVISLTVMGLVLSGCRNERPLSPRAPSADESPVKPESWPLQAAVMPREPSMEARIEALLRRMTVEEKVGQIIQADIDAVTPAQARAYHLGAVLNGGNSAPGRDVRAAPQAWLALADVFWRASTDSAGGRAAVPIMWGTDAVHGHNNVVGATIFPHNIGLGAANDPELVRSIGAATAREIRATGLDWAFAPTVAVARDDRWGRTYESYSEEPSIVARHGAALVEGLQGRVGTDEFLGPDRVLATAKHFLGDGGTEGGEDRGDTRVAEEALRTIHAAGYSAAISQAVQVVMASFNSYRGRKMHGHRALLTEVLVERMGFDGFVIGDWNGHGLIPGCTASACPRAVNAGLDMFMAPTGWIALHQSTVADVEAGRISVARLDEAVARILRVKMRMGLFEAPLPSKRRLAGDWGVLGDPDHKALARRAARKSLVLLKNEGRALPIAAGATVLVAGSFADDIGAQCGGWTLSWQGTGNTNAHFPHGQSVFGGLKTALSAGGGRAVLSPDGTYDRKPDVAVVVFGERPYAEYQGDLDDLDYRPETSLEILRRLQTAGVKTVSVFLSGRPLWVNPELNASDAFVAAWLPGDQGSAVADVLVAKPDGVVNHDFSGRLSFSWPASATDVPNRGTADPAPQFPVGYGLSYAKARAMGRLPEVSHRPIAGALTGRRVLLEAGQTAGGVRITLRDGEGEREMVGRRSRSPSGVLTAVSVDDQAQEDTRQLEWTGPARLVLTVAEPGPWSRKPGAPTAVAIRYRVFSGDVGPTRLAVGCGDERCSGAVDLTRRLQGARDGIWRTLTLGRRCFDQDGEEGPRGLSPVVLASEGPLVLQISSVALVTAASNASCER